VPANPSGWKRILHLGSFALSSFGVVLGQARWRPDWVWVVEPPFFAAPAALLTARLSRAGAWLHVQDFEVDAAFDLGLLQGKRVRRWVAGAERWLMRRFERVSTISPRMRNRLLDKGVEARKALLFPNWVDTAAIFPLDRPSAFRRDLGLAESTAVALYSGNMGRKQGLELLAEAAARLVDLDDLIFVFCGDGAGKAELMAACRDRPNVRFLDLQPLDKLNELLNLADIHLLPQRADAADLVMPSKLTGMLASGRPVLATAQPGTQVAEVLDDRGVVTPPGEVEPFADALRSLACDAAQRARWGRAGRLYAERHLSKDAVLGAFEAALQELTKQPERQPESRRVV
jgi:colanic acid biosynthesis glycosyl transferase WcaI